MFPKCRACALILAAIFVSHLCIAQQNQQLTNDGVVKMVKSGLPERTIVNAVQASDTKFDISANGLIALQKAGVSQTIMDAMIATSVTKRDAGTSAPSSGTPVSPGGQAATPAVGQLSVMLTQDGKQQALPLEKTQLAQTKTKASSLRALSADSALNQVFQGLNADQYEPAIVKLSPTSNNWRLIGASQGKTDALQSSTSDWDVYSNFVEEKIAASSKQLESGHVQIAPASPLASGQYGIGLRPRSKSKKFAGADVAKDQGEGLMFDSAWSFAVK